MTITSKKIQKTSKYLDKKIKYDILILKIGKLSNERKGEEKMKKKLLFLMAAFALFVPSVMAAEITASTDEELIKAFKDAVTGDTIKLTADINNHKGDSTSLYVGSGKEITLDLNGHDITVDPTWDKAADKPVNRSIVIENGKLTITGSGTITHATHVAVNVWALAEADTGHSTLVVGKDVVLKGENGFAVFQYTDGIGYHATVDFYGTVIATGNGATIQGFIKNGGDVPVVNIKKGAKISAVGDEAIGIYGAGSGIWNIEDGVTVESTGTALGIKSGTYNIAGGTFTSTGTYKANPEVKTGSMDAGGAAIQLETNNEYYRHIKLNITGGVFTSANGNAVLEYGNGTQSAVEAINIEDGEFNSAEGKDIFAISSALETAQANKVIKINGGTFNNEVNDEYLDDNKITLVINAAVTENGETVTESMYTIVVEKGSTLDKEELEKLLGTTENGYKLVGYYSDEELKNKFDFSEEITDNTAIYLSFVKEEAKVEEKNPKTSDMNLALILTSLGIASVGTVLVSRRKLAKVNR